NQRQRRPALGDLQRDFGRGLHGAVGNGELYVIVSTRRVEIGRPGELLGGRVKACTLRKIVCPVDERGAFGINGLELKLNRLPFGAAENGWQADKRRGTVGAANVQTELLQCDRAANVERLENDGRAGVVGG